MDMSRLRCLSYGKLDGFYSLRFETEHWRNLMAVRGVMGEPVLAMAELKLPDFTEFFRDFSLSGAEF
jgi:hypothetical protein